LNSSIVIDAILDSAHVFKRKIQIPDPLKQIPHLPLEKSSNSRLLQILNKQIPQVCPGGGCQGFDLIRALVPQWAPPQWADQSVGSAIGFCVYRI
jgi:hypothetical protein